LDDLDQENAVVFQKIKQAFFDYKEKNNENCCTGVVSDLRNEFQKKDALGRTFIKNDDNLHLELATRLECLNCNTKSKENPPQEKSKTGARSSCEFYSKYIRNKDPNDVVPDTSPQMTVEQFMKREVFLCKEGAKNSQIKPVDNWTPSAYGEWGKYGDLADLDLVCMNTPGNDGEGKVGNLSCCNTARDSQAFKEWEKKLNDPAKISALKRQISYGDKNNARTELEKFLDDKEANNRADTFCNQAFIEYRNITNAESEKWGYCEDFENNRFITVDEKFYNSLGGEKGRFEAPSPASKATQE
jgi:hypothetical protein